MLPARAVELAELPLNQSRSHYIKVDRHAARFVLDDRKAQIKEVNRLKSQLSDAEDTVRKQKEQITKLHDEITKLKEVINPKK